MNYILWIKIIVLVFYKNSSANIDSGVVIFRWYNRVTIPLCFHRSQHLCKKHHVFVVRTIMSCVICVRSKGHPLSEFMSLCVSIAPPVEIVFTYSIDVFLFGAMKK
jgi:hypothetical protein